jgi:hypothetical protein
MEEAGRPDLNPIITIAMDHWRKGIDGTCIILGLSHGT